MIVDIVPIAQLQFEKVHYYSVRFENKPVTEFADFQFRMRTNKRDEIELAEINRYIETIGVHHGAWPQHFKDEDAAERLPPPYHQFIESDDPHDYGIRLYCIRLSPSIVVLLNGGRKTALKARDCSTCYIHFNNARKIARKIDEAIANAYIELDDENKEIVIDEDFDLEI